MRNSMGFVVWKEYKQIVVNLKPIYLARTVPRNKVCLARSVGVQVGSKISPNK